MMEFMKTLMNLLISVIVAAWIGAIAIFSIQNFDAVSLRFLTFNTMQLPVGVLLSFCLGGGMVLGAIAPLLWQRPKRANRRRSADSDYDDLEEYEF
jgi:lipopolysaccharide assembly protein A